MLYLLSEKGTRPFFTLNNTTWEIVTVPSFWSIFGVSTPLSDAMEEGTNYAFHLLFHLTEGLMIIIGIPTPRNAEIYFFWALFVLLLFVFIHLFYRWRSKRRIRDESRYDGPGFVAAPSVSSGSDQGDVRGDAKALSGISRVLNVEELRQHATARRNQLEEYDKQIESIQSRRANAVKELAVLENVYAAVAKVLEAGDDTPSRPDPKPSANNNGAVGDGARTRTRPDLNPRAGKDGDEARALHNQNLSGSKEGEDAGIRD